MKKLLAVLLVVGFAIMLACTPANEENAESGQGDATEAEQNEGGGEMVAEDEATTAEQYADQIANHTDMGLMPGTGELDEGKSPHGAFITTYVNMAAAQAMNEGADMMPDGAIVSKENFNADQEFDKTTAMIKKDGEWYWAVYDVEGTVMKEGALQSCIDCHANASNDMLFLWKKAE